MSKKLDVMRGTGNVFADLGDTDADTKQFKARLAAEIIAALNQHNLSVRAGARIAQIDPADIQRIRNADLSRFTLDRLIRIAYRFGRRVEMRVTPRQPDAAA